MPKRFALALAAITLPVLSILAPGCTFGGLADYPIDACEPVLSQTADLCDRLNTPPPADRCMVYQCDPVRRRCVLALRDDDRDGDPAEGCGAGHDCDDANRDRASTAKEVCDGVDNDCDGAIDEDVLTAGEELVVAPAGALSGTADAIVVPTDEARRNALAAFLTPACIPFVAFEPGGSSSSAPCAVTAPNMVPRQPYPLRTATGNAAAFVASNVCTGGRLAYRVRASALLGLDFPCDAAHPAALPSAASMPSTANANSGILTWYEAPITERADPVAGCSTARPAPFVVMRVPDLTTPPATATAAEVLTAAELGVATRPASLRPIEDAGGMLVASPLGDDVGIWLLRPAELSGGSLPPAVHVPLTTARATAIATRETGGRIEVGIAAETGCSPRSSIQATFGSVDRESGALLFDRPVVEVTPPLEIATTPSIAWVAARSEWWVSWVDASPRARVQRLSAEGRPIGAPIEVGSRLPLAIVSAGESVFGLDPSMNGGSFVEVPIRCAPPR